MVLSDTGDALLANEAVRSAYRRIKQKATQVAFLVFSLSCGRGPGEGTRPHPTSKPLHTTIIPLTLGCHPVCKQTVIFLSFEHVMLPREHKTRDIAHPAQ